VNEKCPELPHSRNLDGFVAARLLLSESINSATSVVPFYFQQTLGGQDINSAMALPSYQDYRYRAPNLLLLQESFEHSIWGPFGLKFMADQGGVALTRGDLGFSHLRHPAVTWTSPPVPPVVEVPVVILQASLQVSVQAASSTAQGSWVWASSTGNTAISTGSAGLTNPA